MKLLILGMLMEGPMHGYDLKKTVEERAGDFTDYKFGSVYFALKKLTEQKLTKVVDITAEGARPQKKIYQITDKGKKAFIKLLKERFVTFDRTYYPIDECLFFSYYLDKETVEGSLNRQLNTCTKAIDYLQEHIKSMSADDAQKYKAQLIIEHSLMHMKAEKDWLEKALHQI